MSLLPNTGPAQLTQHKVYIWTSLSLYTWHTIGLTYITATSYSSTVYIFFTFLSCLFQQIATLNIWTNHHTHSTEQANERNQ